MPTSPSVALRWIYCLAVAALALPLGVSSWVRMTVGPSPLAAVPILGPLLFLFLGLTRIYQVYSDRERLDAYEVQGFIRVLRVAGIVGMCVGALYFVAQLSYRPIVSALVSTRSEDGIEFYIVGVYLGLFAGIGPLGLLLFELSRLVGFEARIRKS